MNYLKFVKDEQDTLSYTVYELAKVKTWVVPDAFDNDALQCFGRSRPGYIQFTSGTLRFGTGWDEGWHFISSDDSINWNLGPNLKRAQAELRRRYAEGQRKGAEGDRRRARARQRNTDGDRARVPARRRNAGRVPRRHR